MRILSEASYRKLTSEPEMRLSALHVDHDSLRERYRKLSARCRDLENQLTEIKLGTAAAGYQFEDVPARVIPARVRLSKQR